MSLLQSRRCDAALTRLNDELCSYERSTGREYALIIVPHSSDEKVVITLSGKPLSPSAHPISPQEVLDFALRAREISHQEGIIERALGRKP